MASNEQSATLLRRNKRAQVEALNSLGFNLTESARAADFPMYIKWASGLLDLNVAANRKSDNKRFFFTIEEWQSLSAAEQDLFLLRGIRIRACSVSFIIAPDSFTQKAWGSRGITISDIHSYKAMCDLYTYHNAYEETTLIANAHKNATTSDIVGAPAAETALAYKAFTLERDGLEDTSQWALPAPAHLLIMFRWKHEIDTAFSAVWSPDFKLLPATHWSCGQWSNSEVFYLAMQYGGIVFVGSPINLYAVRPICED